MPITIHYAIAGYLETSGPVDEDTEYTLMLLDVEYESEEYGCIAERFLRVCQLL